MPVMPLPAGTRLGLQADGTRRYTLIDPLGEGGFGITYRARDERLQLDVVLKELASDGSSYRATGGVEVLPAVGRESLHRRMVEKFMTEARHLTRFRNPHIVRVTDVFQENGTAYFVMDYVRSVGRIRSTPPRNGITEDYLNYLVGRIRELLLALRDVHAAGLLHGDVKPGNVLLDEHTGAVLIDFGAARSDAEIQQTVTSTTFTPGYAPFELTHPSRLAVAGPWSDLYSVGMMLVGALVGHPSDDWRPIEAWSRRLEADPYPEYLREMCFETAIPQPLQVAMEWMTRLAVEQRPRDVDDVLPLLTPESTVVPGSPAHLAIQRAHTALSAPAPPSSSQTLPSLPSGALLSAVEGEAATTARGTVSSQLQAMLRSRPAPPEDLDTHSDQSSGGAAPVSPRATAPVASSVPEGMGPNPDTARPRSAGSPWRDVGSQEMPLRPREGASTGPPESAPEPRVADSPASRLARAASERAGAPVVAPGSPAARLRAATPAASHTPVGSITPVVAASPPALVPAAPVAAAPPVVAPAVMAPTPEAPAAATSTPGEAATVAAPLAEPEAVSPALRPTQPMAAPPVYGAIAVADTLPAVDTTNLQLPGRPSGPNAAVAPVETMPLGARPSQLPAAGPIRMAAMNFGDIGAADATPNLATLASVPTHVSADVVHQSDDLLASAFAAAPGPGPGSRPGVPRPDTLPPSTPGAAARGLGGSSPSVRPEPASGSTPRTDPSAVRPLTAEIRNDVVTEAERIIRSQSAPQMAPPVGISASLKPPLGVPPAQTRTSGPDLAGSRPPGPRPALATPAVQAAPVRMTTPEPSNSWVRIALLGVIIGGLIITALFVLRLTSSGAGG
jgi:serine/threonine protein kinase